MRRGREGARRVPLTDDAAKRAIALDFREEQRRLAVEGELRVDGRRQWLVLHGDQLRGVARRIGVFPDHRGHRHAHRVHAPGGDDRMGRHLHIRHDAVHRHRPEMRDLGAVHDRHDPGRPAGGLHVEARDPRVGVRRADEDDVETVRGREVVHVAPGPCQQTRVLAALHRPPDIAMVVVM